LDLADAFERARLGDEEAFQAIYRAVHPVLLRYLRVFVGKDAQEVAAQAWLRIVRDLHRFRGEEVRLWVRCLSVARSRALDHLRTGRHAPAAPVEVDDPARLWAQTDAAHGELATSRALDLIARLPRDQAEAVVLRAVLDLDTRSVAQVLGTRLSVVTRATRHGLRRLAELLGEEPEADSSRHRRSLSVMTPSAGEKSSTHSRCTPTRTRSQQTTDIQRDCVE
jgi:RNA polymerase sigma-70 factor (ECF subfamily)